MGRPQHALQAFFNALRLAPQNPITLEFLGMTQVNVGHTNAAIETLGIALKSQPDSVNIKLHLATAYRLAGRLEDAIAMYGAILASDPANAMAAAGKADALQTVGRHAEATELLAPFLQESKRLNFHVAETAMRLAQVEGRHADAVNIVERYLASGQKQDAMQESRLRMGLGQSLEKTGAHEEAWRRYTEGKSILGLRFDAAEWEKYVERIIMTFSKESIQKASVHGLATSRPVLVVGMPRSGTSLTEEILAVHPDVFGAGELARLQRTAEHLEAFANPPPPSKPGEAPPRVKAPTPANAYPQGFLLLSGEEIHRLAEGHAKYLDSLAPPQAKYVIDKFPGNFMHLGLFAALFPNGKIIHLARQPLDTCVSCYANALMSPFDWAGTLTNIAVAYRGYRRIMEHWRATLGGMILEVQYEVLAEQGESEVRRMLEFLELPWHDGCMRFFESTRAVRTPSRDQVRRPLNQASVGRWRRFERHLGPAKDILGPLLEPDR